MSSGQSEEAKYLQVPDDFPRPAAAGSVGGAQPKLLLTEYKGKFYVPGCTPPELWASWSYCEDLAKQLAAKSLESKAGKRSHMTENQYLPRLIATKWTSEPEARWVMRRVAEILGWPIPEAALQCLSRESRRISGGLRENFSGPKAMEEPVVVFLDFDSVLRPALEPAMGANAVLAGERDAFVWLPILAELLGPHSEVKIIASSDRRCSVNDEELKMLLGPLGVRFFGMVENYDELSKASEIREEVARRGLSRWLAIDDHLSVAVAADGEPATIACDPSVGLNCASIQSEVREKLLKITRHSVTGGIGTDQL